MEDGIGQARLTGAEELAGPADLEIDFGEDEAGIVLFHGLETGGIRVRWNGCKKETVALVVAAADTAAELVELGETEALGALDHDDRGIGDVDTHFDDGG